MVAREHERAEPEAEPALPGGGALRLERDGPQHPEVAEALLDDGGGLGALGVLHDHLQFKDPPHLHRLGNHFGNRAGGRLRAALDGPGGSERRPQAEERGQQGRDSHRRRFSRMWKNLRRGAS